MRVGQGGIKMPEDTGMDSGSETNERVIFRETQRFAQPWIWVIVLLVAGGAWFMAVYGFFADDSAGAHSTPHWLILIIWLLFGCGLPILFLTSALVVEVRPDGIHYRYYPFHRGFHEIATSEIESVQARTYRPIMEYGGWGIRSSWGGKGKAYNVSGNEGVQVELVNGKSILFGSQKAGEFAAAVNSLMRV
jgi:hypothetical protein